MPSTNLPAEMRGAGKESGGDEKQDGEELIYNRYKEEQHFKFLVLKSTRIK